jgi:type VI secretion system (T6SS) effector TldE1-like protein
MTVTAAAFADATFYDRPAVPVRRIGALLARHLFLGTAAVATTGFALVSLALGVGWLVSPTLMHRHNGGTPADFKLRSMALAPSYPGTGTTLRPADIIVFPPTAADIAKPLHVAERAQPRREAVPVVRRPNGVPIPRALPPELASLRSTQRVASLPPAPPSVLRVTPPARVEKPPARTPDSHTAVYDISARSVYLPNGETLEAHSGLGDLRDDPRSLRVRRRGVTPPNTYDLSLREHLFHGVRAIRLTPVDDDKMFGRDGMLAHTYMLGPDGDSNGCVSFKDYPVFLQAYLKGDIDRLVVVPGHGAALAARGSGGRDARYASSEPEPSSSRFSAAQ